MAFDVTTAIPMVRSLNSLIAGSTDTEITEALEQHAIPRIRLALISATGSDGTHVFYAGLDDLSDASKASTAASLVEAVFDEPIVSEGLRRVACAFAASWVINAKVGIIESQQKIALILERQAEKDLDRLCKSPILKSATESARSKLGVSATVPTSLFIALAPLDDQSSVDDAIFNEEKKLQSFDGATLPFVGATEAGRFTVNMNGFTMQVIVENGDEPITIMAKLAAGFDALDPTLKPNVNLAITESPPVSTNRNVPYVDIDGNKAIDRFTFITHGAKMDLVRRDYDKTLDVVVMTAYLEHIDELSGLWVPGIRGLLYGITDNVAGLTYNGPHSVVVDLHTGLATKSTVTDAELDKRILRDTFVFQVSTLGGLTTALGDIVYQINDQPERTVPIPIGSDANNVAELIAQDLSTMLATQRVIGAVRPVTKLQPLGSAITVPTLELVAVAIDVVLAKVVMTIRSSPAEVLFGVSPNNAASMPNFDVRAKSVIVDCTIGRVTAAGTSTPIGGAIVPQGDILLVTHQPTPGLQKILDGLRDRKGF